MLEIKVPELGESVTEGTIGQWLKNEGDTVNDGDIILELETDKVNLEINAEAGGVLKDIRKQEGDIVQVGEVIGLISTEEVDHTEGTEKNVTPPALEEETVRQGQHSESVESNEQRFASPAARRLAREREIDLKHIQTKDPMGRIMTDDIESSQQNSQTKSSQTERDQKGAEPKQKDQTPLQDVDRPVERQRMSRRRQTIAQRLVQVQLETAMLTTFNEVDMTAILDIRRRRKEAFKAQHDVNLGFMSFFSKAVVGALKAFPRLNAEIQDQDMLLKKYYDIGIAVSAKEGLVVPVISHVDRLSFAEIEQQIVALATKARDNTLTLSDLQGGTFTITNGGVFGSLLSTPILNAPQVGILGMHTIQKRPVTLDDDRIESRPMMYIALSYDHRIVDGSEAVQFLVKVKELLEDPETLLLEG